MFDFNELQTHNKQQVQLTAGQARIIPTAMAIALLGFLGVIAVLYSQGAAPFIGTSSPASNPLGIITICVFVLGLCVVAVYTLITRPPRASHTFLDDDEEMPGDLQGQIQSLLVRAAIIEGAGLSAAVTTMLIQPEYAAISVVCALLLLLLAIKSGLPVSNDMQHRDDRFQS